MRSMQSSKRILTCRQGDTIATLETGKKMIVAEILNGGCEFYMRNHHKQPGIRADITAFPVMDNGQILRRNPVYLGQDWRHVK